MYKIAEFEKVSFEQFKKDWLKNCPISKTQWLDDEIKDIYRTIKEPERGTAGSAGYDIYAPCNITIKFGEAKVIPSGLRCKIDDGWFLDINPRSGQGFKQGIRLANTRGIIDSDYYNANNEGHIMIKIVNESCVNTDQKSFEMEEGKAFCQGIFTPYGITKHDSPVSENRTGGFGSTDKK